MAWSLPERRPRLLLTSCLKGLGAAHAVARSSTVHLDAESTTIRARVPAQVMLKKPLHTVTPLIESLGGAQRLGCAVHLKLENTQPSGSYKLRGMGYKGQLAIARGYHMPSVVLAARRMPSARGLCWRVGRLQPAGWGTGC
jgi:hypothetical protein